MGIQRSFGSPFRSRAVLPALGVVLLLGCVFATFHQKDWGLDDAYISYRFASNLVEGHGLVFNPGERVEGYTNFLYVLLIAPGIAGFGSEAAYPFSVAINALFLLAALWAVDAAARTRLERSPARVVSLLFAASPAIWIAASSGLETPLVIAFFATAWAMLSRLLVALGAAPGAPLHAPTVRWLAAALAGMALTRADGFVMAGVFLVYLAARFPARSWRAVAICSAAAVGTTLLQVGGRLLYYGYPLPNSYYAKVGGGLAERLLFASALLPRLTPILPYLVVIAVASLAVLYAIPARWRAFGWRGAVASVPFEVFFPLAWVGYWFYVGGDVFGERFLLVLIPVGAQLLVLHGTRLLAGRGRAPRMAAIAVLFALLLAPWQGTPLFLRRTIYDPWVTLGRFLAERHPDALLAVDAAGKIPFYSGLPAIDMYGLNDATIAHRASRFIAPGHSNSDPYYVLGLEPDIITGWLNPGDLTIDPGFRRYLYTGAGYEIRYLLFAAGGKPPPSDATAVLPVGGLSQQQLQAHYRSGYRYAVLARPTN